MMAMRAISLWQPWASLWCSDRKIHETRSWPTNYRGWLAVHAAKKRVAIADGRLAQIVDAEFGSQWQTELPLGAFVGVVNLIDCRRTSDVVAGWSDQDHEAIDDFHCGDFSPKRFAWQRGAFHRLREPISYSGKQRLFSFSSVIEVELALVAGIEP